MNEENLFQQALAKPPGERAAFLDEACGGDAALRQRVEVLLHAHENPGSFLRPPDPATGPTLDTAVAERPGTVIGPYKLLEQIGEGGFGVVFMAEQTQPIRRRVALKVLKPGMDTRQVIARFLAERQALAIMDHPNIAKIFDGGVTQPNPPAPFPAREGGEDYAPSPLRGGGWGEGFGRPYFVMELVRGVPITDYCDQVRMPPRERLDLFVSVCQAIQHAHQKGIIHRDIKPSNVLVTEQDGKPLVKVIDFGIAKATGQQLTEKTLFTHFAQMIGTPLYMSPEQAGMAAGDVDTRSDIYSLGVLLYELLTGTTPFDSDRMKKSAYDEIRRIIREEDPPKPSNRLSDSTDTLPSISAQRHTEPAKLTKLVRGELDWIVMKALEKDRLRRYDSASAMAVDVGRYLKDEAVEACPPSAVYRVRKFAGRHRVALATCGLVAAALLIGTTVSIWQAIEATNARGLAVERLENEQTARSEAERQRKLAEAETARAGVAEKRATTEAAIAGAVNDFLQVDLLGQAASAPQAGDLESGGEVYLTVKEAVDRAAAQIGHRFQDQPLVEAAIRNAIGRAYNSLAGFQSGLPHLERAVALRKSHLGLDHPATLHSMEGLATATPWVGRHADTIALHEQILNNARARLGPDHPETLEGIGRVAHAYSAAGRFETSGPLLEQLLEKQVRICGRTHPSTLSTMNFMAMNYHHANRLAEAMAMYEKVIELHKSGGHQGLVPGVLGLAQVCQLTGELDRSERILREALAICRTQDNNPRHRTRTANALGWLARVLLLKKEFDEAEPLIREAVAIFEKYEPNATRRFFWTSLWGDVLLGQQKYGEAEPLLLKGFEGTKQLEAVFPAVGQHRVAETGERVVRFYEVTKQPEKARFWREKLATKQAPR